MTWDASKWRKTEEIVYAVDYTRGVDILRFKGKQPKAATT